MSQPLPLDEAIQALERDPTQPVRVRVDGELTVAGIEAPRKSVADLLREIRRWEGETGEQLDALFSDVRQRSKRRVAHLL